MTNRLTGNKRDTIANNTPWQAPVDLTTWAYSEDKEFFDSFNIPREMLFDLQMPGTILGHISKEAAEATGLPEGLPVAATGNDKAVEALGAGLLDNKKALVSLGTIVSTMVYGYSYPKDPVNYWANLACLPDTYLYECDGVRRGMWMVSWFKDLLGDEISLKAAERGISAVELLNQEAADIPPGSEGLMTVPNWLAPLDKRYRKGIMIGFDERHKRAHIYRSILEALALTTKNNFERMCNELNEFPDSILVSGGGAASDVLMQIIADVFGKKATRTVVNGAAGLGSAICAAVAVGAYSSLELAAKGMVKIRDTFSPIPKNQELYARINDEVYKHIVPNADEILKKSVSIFG
jgi:sugar (pentulose or hexulose) kinase